MNSLGLIAALVAGSALLTAIVFLIVHRDGTGPGGKPDPPPILNGQHRRRERQHEPSRLKRLRRRVLWDSTKDLKK